jgi:hypothetical protein
MAYDRRTGRRIAVRATELAWEPMVNGEAASDPGGAQRALMMNVSVTGAGLFGPAEPDRGVGDLFVAGLDNARAIVAVRRVNPTDHAELCYYGVEFVARGRAFERAVYEMIDGPQAGDSTR